MASKPPKNLDFEEKLLDERALRTHLSELERLGEDFVVTLKRSPHNPAEHVSLEDIVAPLVENRAFGGQVEYTYWGHRWLDTLIAGQSGVRLVRLQLTG